MIDKRIGKRVEYGNQWPLQTVGGRPLDSGRPPTQSTNIGEGYFVVIDDPLPENLDEILEELRAKVAAHVAEAQDKAAPAPKKVKKE